MTTLQVKPWQRVVEHFIFNGTRVALEALNVNANPETLVEPRRCFTTLPAIVCECGMYLIETVDDGQGPRPVGYGGEIG